MNNNPANMVIHDTPIRLVIKIITNALFFGVIYIVLSILSEIYPPFDTAKVGGTFLTLDFVIFVALIILQQLITIYWLLGWMNLTYTFDDKEFIVRKGGLFRQIITVSLDSISSVDQKQNLLGRLFHYSTINISVVGKQNFVVIPHMTQPEQVLSRLGFTEEVCLPE